MTVADRRRERRVVVAGVVIVAVALLVTFVLMPVARRWQEREARLATTRARLDSLTALVGSAAQLDSAAVAQEGHIHLAGRRVLRARSSTLAASALQSLLQDAADASRLVVTRLDVAPDAGDSAVVALPATLAAHGDIAGLAELLRRLADGPRLVTVERMTVQINPALRGAPDVLQLTLALRAPLVLE